MLIRDIQTIVAANREEADTKRACFRDLALKATGIGCAGAGVVVGLVSNWPEAGYASIPIVILIMFSQRIGIHKFSSANRIYGYQLHLERLDDRERENLGTLGWEEVCRAWRIVQATLFRAIYTVPGESTCVHLHFGMPVQSKFLARLGAHVQIADLNPRAFRERVQHRDCTVRFENVISAPMWYKAADRSESVGATYHAGSYLERMFSILFIAQLVALSPIMWAVIRLYSMGRTDSGHFIALWFFGVFLLLIITLNHLALRERRIMLERGLLSIHSCSLMWRAVAMAHVLAWDKRGRPDYTERLSQIAVWMAFEPRLLRDWIAAPALPNRFVKPMPILPNGTDDVDRAKVIAIMLKLLRPVRHQQVSTS